MCGTEGCLPTLVTFQKSCYVNPVMTKLISCKQCGIHESSDTIVHGLCEECIQDNRQPIEITRDVSSQSNSYSSTFMNKAKDGITFFSRVLRWLQIALSIYIIAIIIKIVVISLDGKIVKYAVKDLSVGGRFGEATWDGETPKLLPLNPRSYKFDGSQIVAKTAGGINVKGPPDCKIWDLKNWECTWGYDALADGNYFESMENGSYYEFIQSWSLDETKQLNKYNDIGEFAYNINGCKWDFYEGLLNGLIVCPLRFAFFYN